MRIGAVLSGSVLLIAALSGCAATAPVAAEVESREWTLGFTDEKGLGCTGTATLTTGTDWALSDGRLVQGNDTGLYAYCATAEYYAPHIGVAAPDLTVQDIVALLWEDGRCSSAPEVTISGQPGILCEHDASGNHYVEGITLVEGTYVQLEGWTPGGTDDIKAAIESAILTVG